MHSVKTIVKCSIVHGLHCHKRNHHMGPAERVPSTLQDVRGGQGYSIWSVTTFVTDSFFLLFS